LDSKKIPPQNHDQGKRCQGGNQAGCKEGDGETRAQESVEGSYQGGGSFKKGTDGGVIRAVN